jgi:hypothetical protein
VLSKPITPKSMNVLGHGLALPLNRQSLDLATGPLINFGGASAAYSLRDLNGRNPRIVRVRRASDNHERDFYKDDINSGELTNWVNSQIVPPLDIGVETSEGRIPVPEGGASIGTPAAAYSLRNLSTTYTGNVVDVRRSRNNAEDSFTAAEVADGTLEAWVTEEQVGWNVQPTWDVSSGNGVITSQSKTATTSTFSITTISGESLVRQTSKPNHIIASSGDRVVANITISGFDVPVSARLRTAGTNTNVAEQTLSNGTADYTFNLTGSGGYFAFSNIEATSGATLTINSIKVIGRSGFVSKWYDQSGNGNHATQGTAASQPKIVNGGVFLGEVDFNGVSTFLETNNSNLSTLSELSLFSVLEPVTENVNEYAISAGSIVNSTGNYGGWALWANGFFDRLDFATQARGSVTNSRALIAITSTSPVVYSATLNGTDAQASVNGVLGTENTNMITPNNTDAVRRKLRLGCQYTFEPASFYSGAIKEVILYTTDQSANRTAIEANIGETYGITGIPAYDNTVDGFVETWYDQSGNGNDATQSVAASQPKIVSAGVLVSGGIGF